MRLKEDTFSWRSSGIQRRMYRQAPLTPEQETPRHKKNARRKKKHIHDWQPRIIGRQVVSRTYREFNGSLRRIEREENKVQYVCSRCGNKRGRNYWGW